MGASLESRAFPRDRTNLQSRTSIKKLEICMHFIGQTDDTSRGACRSWTRNSARSSTVHSRLGGEAASPNCHLAGSTGRLVERRPESVQLGWRRDGGVNPDGGPGDRSGPTQFHQGDRQRAMGSHAIERHCCVPGRHSRAAAAHLNSTCGERVGPDSPTPRRRVRHLRGLATAGCASPAGAMMRVLATIAGASPTIAL